MKTPDQKTIMSPEKTTYSDGSESWYLNGELHREDGPAVIRADGSESWYLNGKLHREDGPAVIRADGSESWYLNGELHREDGPAVTWADGSESWYLNGKQVDQLVVWLSKDINQDNT